MRGWSAVAMMVLSGFSGCERSLDPDAGSVLPDAGAVGSLDAGNDAGAADGGSVDSGTLLAFTPGSTWGNLQFPPFISSAPGGTTTVYGQLWVAGVTQTPGPSAGVEAELGLGPTGTLPWSAPGWTWVPAAFNVDVGNNDEFGATLTAPAAGLFDYAYRYRLQPGGPWGYADRSDQGLLGTDDGYQPEHAGHLAVRVPGATLKVATQNLHCLDAATSARLDLAAAGYAAMGVDAVSVQEACIDATLGNTAQVLADRLTALSGRPWQSDFLETHLTNGVTHEGVAVLTALPVLRVDTLVLPTVSFGRGVVRVLAASPVGVVSLSTVHLSFEATSAGAADRLAQADAIASFESSLSPLVGAQLIAGDFNSGPADGPSGVLTDAGFLDAWAATQGAAPGLTFPTAGPSARIDYVLVGAVTPTAAQLVFAVPLDGGVAVSDHLGVFVTVTAQ